MSAFSFVPDPPRDPVDSFRDAMIDAGIEPPAEIVGDGELHRFGRGNAAWYVLYLDEHPAGIFGDWRMGVTHKWVARGGTMSASRRADLDRIRAERDQERAAKNHEAAERAARIWAKAQPAPPDHPYLVAKGIRPHIARITKDGRLVLPVHAADGTLMSVQFIDGVGDKQFLAGGKTSGGLCIIGAANADRFAICEGFATGASVHEGTGETVLVAFNAANITKVAEAIRAAHPSAVITIWGDNDKSGTGQKAAREAGEAVGARVLIPAQVGDWNDVHREHGAQALRRAPADTAFRRFDIVSGQDIPETITPPNEVVQNLLVAPSTAILFGPSNTGKSFAAVTLEACIASGRDFLGRKVDSGVAVYLAVEAPPTITERLALWRQRYGGDLSRAFVVRAPVNFHQNQHEADELIDALQLIASTAGPIRLVVADTLARISAGANENAGTDMGPVMAQFDRIAKATGAAVLILHHSGKDSAKGSRGWSGLLGHVDTEIEITESKGVHTLTVTKERRLNTKGRRLHFSLEVSDIGISKFGEPMTSAVVVPAAKPTSDVSDEERRIKTGSDVFSVAWQSAGSERTPDGAPYLTRSAFKTYLMGYPDELTSASADAALGPAKDRDPVNMKTLLTSGLLIRDRAGYIANAGLALRLNRQNRQTSTESIVSMDKESTDIDTTLGGVDCRLSSREGKGGSDE